MIGRVRGAAAILIATGTAPAPAAAQQAPSVAVEVATDEVRRGISWSRGAAAASADIAGSLGPVDASARVVTLRGAARHDGAWSVVDLGLGTAADAGAVRIRAAATAHLFAGAGSRSDYGEIGLAASYAYGPVLLTAGADLAPSQRAIGGSNLHLYADAEAGIPRTPFTVIAGLGRSSGTIDDPDRARRLRPGGAYTDWRLSVEHRRGRLTLGLDYRGTDIGDAAGRSRFADIDHATDRLVGRLRVAL